MAVTTLRADVLGTVPTIVADTILKYTMPNLEFGNRVNTDIGRSGFNVGDTLQIPLFNDTASTPDTGTTAAVAFNTGSATGFSGTAELTPLVATYVSQTIGSVKVYVANWFYFAVELSAYAAATTSQDLIPVFKQAGLDTLAVHIDTLIANNITNLTAGGNPTGTLATALTDDLILDGIAGLDAGNVPAATRSFVFGAQEKANFFKLDKYTNSLYRGNTNPLTKGELGNLYGMDWAWTTQVQSASSGHRNAMFHRDAIANIMRKDSMVKVADSPDPGIATRIIAQAIWAQGVIRARFGVCMAGL